MNYNYCSSSSDDYHHHGSGYYSDDYGGYDGHPYHEEHDSYEDFQRSSAVAPKGRAKAPSASSSTNSRGNAKNAATLRISAAMTIPQLQAECKHRGVSGYSGKTKDWLLQQLGEGSVWQVMRQQTAKTATKKAATTTTKKDSTAVKPKKSKSKAAATVKSTPKAAPTKKVSTSKPAPKAAPKKRPVAVAAKTASTTSTLDCSKLPIVTSSLTIAQLSHEFQSRHAAQGISITSGLSSKPKSWFLQQLGICSVWTTSPEAIKKAKQVAKHPKVTSSTMTMAQLIHELSARTAGSPGGVVKGLSSKSKDDLLQLAGVGSLWITGSGVTSTPAKAKSSTTTTAATKTKKPAASTNKRKTKAPIPDHASSGAHKKVKREPMPVPSHSFSGYLC